MRKKSLIPKQILKEKCSSRTYFNLYSKYERSKQLTAQLKESEDALKAELAKTHETLQQQEQRYEKMKNHAIQQLDM